MLKEEVKSLIQEAGFKGDNLDEIIDTCYKELFNDDKYQGYEGIFYYEMLQVISSYQSRFFNGWPWFS
jgi:hypothetical protein